MFHILSWKEIESEPYFNSLKKEISKILAGFSIIHFSCMYITNNIFISTKIRKNRTSTTYYIAKHRVSIYNRKNNNENIKGNSDSKES